MIRRILPIGFAALVLAACGGGSDAEPAMPTPERAVVAWFEAVDAGDAETAAVAVSDVSLALMLGVENGLEAGTIATYIADGVPDDLASDYWRSFADGFTDFASRPISTLTVGESTQFEVEDHTFAAVPISSGPGSDSVVFVRQAERGGWEVDLVATLADGFSTVFADRYAGLGADESVTSLREAYREHVVPALWAAMAEGDFGDEFNRVALTLLNEIEG